MNFTISEVVPNKKIVWMVTNCNLHWVEDKQEWIGTQVIWSLSENNGNTQIDFVHKGLTQASECYVGCKPG